MTQTAYPWPVRRLQDVAAVRAGRTPSKLEAWLADRPRDDRTVPFYKVGDMNAHASELKLARTYVAPDELATLGLEEIPVGSSVFPKVGGAVLTNKKRLVTAPGAVDLNTMAIVPGEALEPRFLRAWLERLDLRTLVDGSVLPQIPKSRIQALLIPVPGVSEQRRIVDLLEDHLSRLDAGTSLLSAAERRSEAWMQAVVRDVYSTRARTERWPVVALEDLATTPRAIVDGPFGSKLASRHYADDGARVVRLQNIGNGVFRQADAFISLERYEELAGHGVRQGDVVVASLGDDAPRAAVVPDLGGPAIVKADCIRVRLDDGIQPEWVVWACTSRELKTWAANRMHGVGRQRLGLAGIRKLPIPLGPAELRSRLLAHVAEQASAAERLRAAIERERTHAAAMRRAILEAAFSGRLTGRNADTEIVEELVAAGA
ncbi:restriction endonuclease subunit S [Blastococcus capsensis]|uniref:restriction endonuclease subunit S n=1 Tax=Blastococcus capsensis TaxID=1564163 RepID=UPI0025400994|nr:restriction endonuclease subunit S [Blastococcus capsensis]MDK3255194.1 restriction endonuclease subunit S [Blastococcus capsensis]